MITENRRISNRVHQRKWREKMRTQIVRVSREKMVELWFEFDALADVCGDLSSLGEGVSEDARLDRLIEFLRLFRSRFERQRSDVISQMEAECGIFPEQDTGGHLE